MFSFITKSISLKDKVLFYESIANLLDWWVTLLSAIKWFIDRIPDGTLKDTLENTLFFLESGDAMNVAMRKLPNFYESKEIAIVESGEQTGMLKDSFNAIANELRMQEDLKRKVIGALTYPFVVLAFLIMALIVVMMFVIPQIMPLLGELTTEISFATRSLIWVSDFFRNYIVLLLMVVIAIWLIFRGYIVTDSWKKWFDAVKLYAPWTGKVYKNYLVVQVMSTFHLLSSSWVSIVKALKLTWESAWNSKVEDMFVAIAQWVSAGRKISESMQEVDKERYFFSPDIIQIIESAEKTSTVHEVTAKISEQYRREVDAALAMMVKFIEPVALLAAGVFVLWFAAAIFSSIMQMVNVAGQ